MGQTPATQGACAIAMWGRRVAGAMAVWTPGGMAAAAHGGPMRCAAGCGALVCVRGYAAPWILTPAANPQRRGVTWTRWLHVVGR